MSTQATPGQSAPTPSEKAMALLAKTGVVGKDAGSEPTEITGAGASPADAASQEVTVDWGGVSRKVKMADLVTAAMGKEKTEQMQQLIDDRLKLLANAEALTDLHGRLQKLSPEQKQRMLAVIEGQDVQDEPDDESDSMDDIASAVAPARNGKAGANPLERRMAQTEGALRELAQILLNEQQAKEVTKEQTKATDVLGSFPELARDENARTFITEWVRQARTINPRADVEDLVTKAAQRLQKIRDGGTSAAYGEVVSDQRTGPVRLPEVNGGKPFTAEDMAKGKTRQAVAAMLKQLR